MSSYYDNVEPYLLQKNFNFEDLENGTNIEDIYNLSKEETKKDNKVIKKEKEEINNDKLTFLEFNENSKYFITGLIIGISTIFLINLIYKIK